MARRAQTLPLKTDVKVERHGRTEGLRKFAPTFYPYVLQNSPINQRKERLISTSMTMDSSTMTTDSLETDSLKTKLEAAKAIATLREAEIKSKLQF